MKNISFILCTVLFTSGITLANEINTKTSFQNGDIVKVSSCDKFGWCKLSDESGYVKNFWFIQSEKDKNILIYNNKKEKTYLYELVGIEEKNITIKKFIWVNKVEPLISNARKNYKYGYIRKVDVQSYMKDYEIVQKNDMKIFVKKEEPKSVEKFEEKNKDEKQQNYFTYFDLGVAKFNSNHPDNLDMMVDLGFGYKLDKSQFITFGYMGNIENSQDQLRGVELNNLYVGYNYNFLGEYNPTLGVIAGYSAMSVYLDKNSGSSIAEEKDNKIFYGIEARISNEINNNLLWEIKSSYLQYDLKTPNLHVTNSINLFAGIVYKFD